MLMSLSIIPNTEDVRGHWDTNFNFVFDALLLRYVQSTLVHWA